MCNFHKEADMQMTKGQFLTLSDICRETAVVIFGGLVIGSLLVPNINRILTVGGFIVYLILSFAFSLIAFFTREKKQKKV
jgi:hypothetical protein